MRFRACTALPAVTLSQQPIFIINTIQTAGSPMKS